MPIDVMLNNLMSLFLLIIIGYIVGKTKFINPNVTGIMTDILLKIILPINILCTMMRPFEMEMLVNSGIIFVLAIVTYGILVFFGLLSSKIFRIKPEDKGVFTFAIMFSNAGFMGFPILLAMLGSEGLFYGSIVNIAFNLYAFTVGIKLICMGQKSNGEYTAKSILTNSVNISIVVGMFFFLTGFKLPAPIFEGLSNFGNMTSPMSMFILGLILSKSSLFAMLKGKTAYIICFLSLIAAPFLLYGMLVFLPIDEILLKVIILLTAMPVATMGTMLAEKYNGNSALAANAVFLSNVFCIVTIPFIMLVLF